MPSVCETYNRKRAMKNLGKGRVVLLAAGTGNPFFTTDTTAVLRAAELEAQAVLKATNVDGVYSADPKKDPKAKRYEKISHQEALEKDLKVMDGAAFALARRQAGLLTPRHRVAFDTLRWAVHAGAVQAAATAFTVRALPSWLA